MNDFDAWYADSAYLWCWAKANQDEVPVEQCGYPTKELALAAAAIESATTP